jgi:hypothetical protein
MILIAVLVPVSWIILWLIIGLWESWMSFKGVILGLHRKRGLPYAWCCVSIFFLCCVGPTYKAKSAEEQAELLEKWNAIKRSEKFKLWMKWGFRWNYPDMLGDEPEFAGDLHGRAVCDVERVGMHYERILFLILCVEVSWKRNDLINTYLFSVTVLKYLM